MVEWDKVKEELLSDPEIKEEYEKIPNPYFDGEYIWVPLDNGEVWPQYVGFKKIDLADYPTIPMQPIKQNKFKTAMIGLAYSSPIWIAAGFVFWAVGRGKGWW
jgi:hypothetical protein